jgi:hypothetical protein
MKDLVFKFFSEVVGVRDSWGLLKAYALPGEDVAVSYVKIHRLGRDPRKVSRCARKKPPRWRFARVWRPGVAVDPGGPPGDYGDAVFWGASPGSTEAAMEWASDTLNVVEWDRSPLDPNTFLPKQVVDRAKAAFKGYVPIFQRRWHEEHDAPASIKGGNE